MWIVMTSAAHMPNSVRSRYRNVALIKLTAEYARKGLRPAMISSRARGVETLIHYGHHYVGRTDKAAYQRTLAKASAEAQRRNDQEKAA